jgi:hypothetical protein
MKGNYAVDTNEIMKLKFSEILTPKEINTVAKETGFVQRKSKIDPFENRVGDFLLREPVKVVVSIIHDPPGMQFLDPLPVTPVCKKLPSDEVERQNEREKTGFSCPPYITYKINPIRYPS